jgi:hypothetical protein
MNRSSHPRRWRLRRKVIRYKGKPPTEGGFFIEFKFRLAGQNGYGHKAGASHPGTTTHFTHHSPD